MTEVGALRVSLGLDSANFTKSLTDINRKLKGVDSEFKAAGGSVKGFENTLEGLQAKSSMLTSKIELQGARLQELKLRYEQSAASKGKDAAETENALIKYNTAIGVLKKMEDELQKTNTKMNNLSQEVNKSVSAWDRLRDKMNQVGQRMQDVGGRMQSVGQSMATSFGAATAVIGGALGLAVNKSMDFEAQISRVGAISDATSTDLQALRKSALDLGASTSKSASEVAVGQEALAALGFTANEIIGAMPGVISAAEASGSDMAQTAEVMASTLNIFGMEASKATDVADILAKTANVSAADLTDMQYALKYAGPPAAALGVSLEELSASIGIMTNAGMQGEQAGTTLRGGLLALLDPSKENAEMMEKMGIQITDASGNFVGLSQLIENISSSMEGMTDTQKAANLASLVGTEAVSGFLSLMKAGPTEIDKMTLSLENSTGASAEAATKMKDNLKGALDELSGSFETAQISIGTALTPAILKISEVLKSLTERFNNLSPNTQKFIAIGAALTAALTGIIAVIGFLAMGIGGVIAAIGTIGLPIAAAIAAVIGLGAVFGVAYAKIEPFREGVQRVFQKIQQIISSVMYEVTQFFQDKILEIRLFWAANGEQIKQAFSNVFKAIKTVIDFIMPAILFVIKSIWGNIKGVFNGALNIILGLVKTFSSLFTGDWKGVWEGIKQIFTGAIELLWNGFQLLFVGRLLKGAASLWAMFTGLFKGGFTKIIGAYKGFYGGLFNLWKSGATQIWKVVDGMVSKIVDFFIRMVPKLKTLGKDAIEGLINGIKGAGGKAAKAAGEVAKGVADAVIGFFKIKSPSRLMMTVGGHVVDGLSVGMKNNKSAEKEAKEKAIKIKKQFSDELDKSKDNYKLGKIDTKEYITSLNAIKTVYAKLPEQIRTVELEIQKAQKIAAEEAKKVTQQKIDNEKAVIDNKKYYGELSLEEELKRWQNIIAITKKGSEERINAERNVFRVKEDIRKRDFENGKAAIDNLVRYNNISLGQQLDALRELQSKYKQGSEEWLEIDRRIADTKISIHAELKSINDEYLKNVQEVNTKLIEEENKLNAAYDQALKDRTSTLTNFVGLFDEIKPKEDALSGTQLINNLQGQVDAFKSWQDSLSQLQVKGLDEGLLKELQAMGPKSQQEIQALTTLTDVELGKYTELWKTKHKLAAEQATKELEPLKVETTNKIVELKIQAGIKLDEYKGLWVQKTIELRSGVVGAFNPVIANMRQIGEDTMKGLMAGLASMEGPLQEQATAIANSISKTIKTALKIKSPSRVTMQLGSFVGEGLAVGMRNSISQITRQARMMANAAVPTLRGSAIALAGGASGSSQTINHNYYAPLVQSGDTHLQDTADVKTYWRARDLTAQRLKAGGERFAY
jgi:TP901 family phage tail tape measure protein